MGSTYLVPTNVIGSIYPVGSIGRGWRITRVSARFDTGREGRTLPVP
jgi:hypothetical protein